ncbi:MAG: hypothetical protein GY807_24810 [Gammaproteobacteria bacterium]|nr:hypothetical protein [Gammaproteobacteria bacterium]
MKKYGMLMTPPLAQKAYDGDKTVTRRLTPWQPDGPVHWYNDIPDMDDGWWEMAFDNGSGWYPWKMMVPRYRPGMVVAVKETHWRFGRKVRTTSATGRLSWKFKATGRDILFMCPDEWLAKKPDAIGWHKIPNLFLPFNLARTHIKILDVRPDDSRDITEADVAAEGFASLWEDGDWHIPGHTITHPSYNGEGVCVDPGECSCGGYSAKEAWPAFWDSINPTFPWALNPWVWRYQFERVVL